MTNVPSGTDLSPPLASAPPAATVDKREQAEKVVSDILRLMGVPARIEVKEVLPVKPAEGKPGLEGGISVALYPEGELPGGQAGRRSHLVDAVQFLANKIVNRPQAERKWISIGVGGHPEPRLTLPPRTPGAPRAQATAPAASPPGAPAPAVSAPARREGRPPRAPRAEALRPASPATPAAAAQPAEETLEVSADPRLEAIGRALFDKSARLGRYYAVVPMSVEDRAKALKATRGLTGASVRIEGEGRNRRLVFVPDKPAPMPKKAIPDYGDEEG